MAEPLHGIMAEFEKPQDLLEAARRCREAGYRKMDAYTPFPVEGLSEAVGFPHTHLPLLVLIGGLVGALVGYGMQYYLNAVDYPLNVAGRPLNSLTAFVPITFECTVLVAAFTAALGMLALNGLPLPYHPVFNVPRFAMASRDRFFLVLESGDPRFSADEARRFLQGLGPKEVYDVPA